MLKQLIEKNQGCNLTLFNPNMLKEGNQSDDEAINDLNNRESGFISGSSLGDNQGTNTDRKKGASKSPRQN